LHVGVIAKSKKLKLASPNLVHRINTMHPVVQIVGLKDQKSKSHV